jgi:DNA processing protein
MNINLMKINYYSLTSQPYLTVLQEVAHPPKGMYCVGALPRDLRLSVAIVGTRRPTPYGKAVTFELAYALARRNVIIVSGLAFGIDAVAHEAALEAGGTTIAVMAGGLDHIYPASHTRLAERIVDGGGAILSEYPEGTRAHKYHFLARNRLISGLASVVIVTEAGERSGTLSTVNHALEQGKDVYAVPGPITSVQSVGPNRLLQQGAAPLVSVDEFVQSLVPRQAEAEEGDEVLSLIRQGITSIEELIKRSHLDTPELLSRLSLLEIEGRVRSSSGHWVAL